MEMHEKIKYLRNKHNLTLEQVGNAVGVGKSTVRKWETGQIANMRRDKIAKLAQILNTTPSYLMGWDEQEQSSKSEQLLQLIDDLSDENKDKAIEYFQFLLSTQK